MIIFMRVEILILSVYFSHFAWLSSFLLSRLLGRNCLLDLTCSGIQGIVLCISLLKPSRLSTMLPYQAETYDILLRLRENSDAKKEKKDKRVYIDSILVLTTS